MVVVADTVYISADEVDYVVRNVLVVTTDPSWLEQLVTLKVHCKNREHFKTDFLDFKINKSKAGACCIARTDHVTGHVTGHVTLSCET
eukprot:1933108-Rhodomonas_salina.2